MPEGMISISIGTRIIIQPGLTSYATMVFLDGNPVGGITRLQFDFDASRQSNVLSATVVTSVRGRSMDNLDFVEEMKRCGFVVTTEEH